ncbi:MAG: DUF2490 domain-containing protein [Saprospiraceae bacterium]|nr:DUF2490 domain-containing protein [Saprospiraceae bacterium]
MKRFIILFFFLICYTALALAQKTVSYSNHQWFQYYNELQLSKKATLYSDISLRRVHNLNQWSQMTFRTGIGYPITNNFNGITGIACFTFYKNDILSKIEFRPYQEINSKQKFDKFLIQHRFRIEFRYFREIVNNEITENDSFNYRFRYRLFCSIPIIRFSDKNPEKKILLNFGDEIFVNTGREIIYNMLDNNRIILGPAFQFNDNLNISLTYTYQFGQRNNPSAYEHSDIIWLGINHKLSLVKN